MAFVEVESNPESFEYQGLLFSTVKVKVVKAIKGSEDVQSLVVLDQGGEYHGNEYALGGAPLMHSGERWLLFLHKYEGPVTTSEVYAIRGVWQGKIRVDSNDRLLYVGPRDETKPLQRDIRRYTASQVGELGSKVGQ